MTWVGSAVGAVGGAIGGLGNKYAASSQANALEYSSQLHDQNKGVIEDQTKADVSQLRSNMYKQIGSQRAAASASGVGVDGSVLDVLEESTRSGILDRQRREYQGQLDQRNEGISSYLDKFYAASSRKSGTMMAAAGGVQAAGSAYSSLSKSTTSAKT